MNNGAATLYAEANEDKPFSVLARPCSLSGTGSEYVQGEGPAIKVADVASIACKVYDIGTDRDAATGTEVTPAPSLTSANVFDTPRTAGWQSDTHGYTFRHDVAVAFVADPAEWRLLEYTITLTDGTTVAIEVRVYIRPKVAS